MAWLRVTQRESAGRSARAAVRLSAAGRVHSAAGLTPTESGGSGRTPEAEAGAAPVGAGCCAPAVPAPSASTMMLMKDRMLSLSWRLVAHPGGWRRRTGNQPATGGAL